MICVVDCFAVKVQTATWFVFGQMPRFSHAAQQADVISSLTRHASLRVHCQFSYILERTWSQPNKNQTWAAIWDGGRRQGQPRLSPPTPLLFSLFCAGTCVSLPSSWPSLELWKLCERSTQTFPQWFFFLIFSYKHLSVCFTAWCDTKTTHTTSVYPLRPFPQTRSHPTHSYYRILINNIVIDSALKRGHAHTCCRPANPPPPMPSNVQQCRSVA